MSDIETRLECVKLSIQLTSITSADRISDVEENAKRLYKLISSDMLDSEVTETPAKRGRPRKAAPD